MRDVLVGGVIVLFEVNSQEDGSVCCVFIGTMIHINNLARLPYSPFILFSSLPFDIPLCFHSQREHIVPRKWERNIKRASGNKPFIPISEKLNGFSAARQQCMDNSIQELHICTYTCIGMPAHWYACSHTQRESHIQIETLNVRRYWHCTQHWSYNLLLSIKLQGYWSNNSICGARLLPNC